MTIVIDADAHIVEPLNVWQEYADPTLHDSVPKDILSGLDNDSWEQVITDEGGREWIQINTFNPESIAPMCIPGGLSDSERAHSLTWNDLRPASFDPHVRIKEMDAVGVDVTMIYPSLGLYFGSITDPAVAGAACRRYNDWMAEDFCKPYPGRLYNVAPVPLQGVDEAVKEMRRVVTEQGVKAVTIRPNPYNNRQLCDPAYGPFWEEAQELDCTVALHSSVTGDMPTIGFDRYRDFFRRMVIAHPFEQQMACMDLICGGVLEQYPRLRIAIVETGAGWLPYWLSRLDDFHSKLGRMVPPLSLKPSEYFHRQCFLACEPDDVVLKSVEALGIEDVLMWASDYPHFDCGGPAIVEELRESCEGLPESVQGKVLGDNAARCYGLT